MHVDAGGDPFADLLDVGPAAARAESEGYDAYTVPETRHDASSR
jgi:hypothetical protein